VLQGVRTQVAALVNGGQSGRTGPSAPWRDERHDPWDELRTELARSRRYERKFVLLQVPCRGALNGRAPRPGGGVRSCREQLLEVSAFLRSVDRAWLAEEDVYVLLPESDRAMGEAFLARVRRLAPEVLPVEGVQLAAFPEDGATSGALLAALDRRPLPAVTALTPATRAGGVELRPKRADDRQA